jgi:hypothetical protein
MTQYVRGARRRLRAYWQDLGGNWCADFAVYFSVLRVSAMIGDDHVLITRGLYVTDSGCALSIARTKPMS